VNARSRTSVLAGLRRIALTLAGAIVLVVGIAMIVLPGPAIVFVPAGLSILALEYAWARRWLATVRAKIRAASPRGRPPRV
jgi:hypothetical protein